MSQAIDKATLISRLTWLAETARQGREPDRNKEECLERIEYETLVLLSELRNS